MAQTKTMQTSFVGGEISPALYGRTDLQRYRNSTKLCENMMVHAYGGVSNRAGTRYIANAYDDNVESVLIPYIYSTEISYVLELSHKTVVGEGTTLSTVARVIKENAVLQDDGSDIEIEINATLHLDLSRIYYAQDGAIMMICHPDASPVKVYRATNDETDWSCDVLTFGSTLSAPNAPTVADGGTGSGGTKSYYYKITRVKEELGEESLASNAGNDTNYYPLSPTCWMKISWAADNASVCDGYNIYRYESGMYSWIGYAVNTGAGTIDFYDYGLIADMTKNTPKSVTAFGGNQPSVIALHEQRAFYAASVEEPQKFWASRTGNYYNFNTSYPLQDNSPFSFSIASSRLNEIRHFISIGDLIVLTSGGEYIMSGGGALTPTTANIKQKSYWGASYVKPIVIGNTVLFIDRSGNKLRDLIYSYEVDGLAGNEVSILVPHLLREYQLKSLVFQQRPNNVIWMVRDDGVLLGCTYIKEQEVVAWHHHITDGEFESICVLPSNNRDEVYVTVLRDGKRYIEKFMPSVLEGIEQKECFYVDSGLVYDGTLRGSVAEATITLSDIEGDITITSDENVFVSGDVGKKITVQDDGIAIITAYTSETEVSATVEDTFSDTEYSYGDWAFAVDAVTGLEHLEGKTVSVFTDGSVHPQEVVSSGEVSLDWFASYIVAGLPYTSKIQTLDLFIDSKTSDGFQSRPKAIKKIILKVESSTGFMAGYDETNLIEQKVTPAVWGTPPSLYTGDWELQIEGSWDRPASIYIEQTSPVPINILSLIQEVEIATS